jgi:transposase InsO family protein
MNHIYSAIGTTKQNLHQRLKRSLKREELEAQLIDMIHQVRKDHPVMGAASLYKMIKPVGMGRDRFIQMYSDYGFQIHQKKNYRKTTNSDGVRRFANHLQSFELNGINQAFCSDLTYYKMGDTFFYLTFIMDIFSRVIKGYSVSRTMRTNVTTLPALKRALRGMSQTQTQGLIFHSDGGGQYYSDEFLELTRQAKMVNSMCSSVYENPHAERVNGTIKNSYLKHFAPHSFKSLVLQTKRAVRLYNREKPHEALNGLAPVDFEKIQLSYSQKSKLPTKKKETKKKNNSNSNYISNSTPKTVNSI